jgi:hypothetical protein
VRNLNFALRKSDANSQLHLRNLAQQFRRLRARIATLPQMTLLPLYDKLAIQSPNIQRQ